MHKTYARAMALLLAGMAAAAVSLADFSGPARAQTASDTLHSAIGGKPVALTVTGDGEVNVKPVGFSLSVIFYNDAIGPDAAATQNVQTEARLREAVLRAGAKPDEVQTPFACAVGVSTSDVPNSSRAIFLRGTPKPTETARAMHSLIVMMRGVNGVKPLVAALQKVGAAGFITISYDFGDNKTLRNRTLQKAVGDAAAQAKIMETAALPRRLRLVALETGEFSEPSLSFEVPLSVKVGAPPALPAASEASARQSVTLRYALADTAPIPVKIAAKSAPQKKR